jgi:septal ring factor EnvC (AmiA/AmiB activator)
LLRSGDRRGFRIIPIQERRMDATAETVPPSSHPDYKSRPGALIWFFRKSRDSWRRKYLDLKATEKGYKNRIVDLTKSRERWRTEAEQASRRLAASEAENAELRARIAAAEEKKKRTSARDR